MTDSPRFWSSFVLALAKSPPPVIRGVSVPAVRGRQNGRDGLTTALCEERNDIARDKNLGHPLCPYQSVLFSTEQPDQPAEDHVDGRGEQRRTEEDEEGLEDVDDQGEIRCFRRGDCSTNISDCFDCVAVRGELCFKDGGGGQRS
jgi:hypothetical protein